MKSSASEPGLSPVLTHEIFVQCSCTVFAMKSLLKRLSCLFLRLEGLISQCFTSDASQLGLCVGQNDRSL